MWHGMPSLGRSLGEILGAAQPQPLPMNINNVTVSFFTKEDLTTFVDKKAIKLGNTISPSSLSFIGKTESKLILKKLPVY